MKRAIVWFRRDLRLADNPALTQALTQCDQIIPIYIHSPDEEAPWQSGAASNWWLHHSLKSLDQELRQLGSRLIILKGPCKETLLSFAQKNSANEIHWNRLYEPAAIKRDSEIKNSLGNAGIDCFSHNASLLIEPWELLTKKETPFKVFTAYWNTATSNLTPQQPLPAPPSATPTDSTIKSLDVNRLGLLSQPEWHRKFESYWQPGEQNAHTRLLNFINHQLDHYEQQRDIPGIDGTSTLSPYLHFGEISPKQIIWALYSRQNDRWMSEDNNLQRFVTEIGWREFAHYLLHHFPESHEHPLDKRFEQMPWNNSDQDRQKLQQWQSGQTGIPIVDAGMRELWETGWMHNRVRMIAASMLTKNLGIHWLEGARWFWDTLLDADLASNTLGWQWTAGCGADAAPFFRIFNPVRQGERFDPNGDYIHRWIPELKDIPKKYIHSPWLYDGEIDYPAPIVDLSETRKLALERWDMMRSALPIHGM